MLTNTDPTLRDAAAMDLTPGAITHINEDTARLVLTRGQTHGAYSDHARYTQALKQVAYRAYHERSTRGQPVLTVQQKESVEMILHKLGRILAGDASFADHWDDVAGYAHIANKEF